MKNYSNTYILIMAGGVGSRFWPKSRNQFPKQFIDILGIGKSLLQLTYERFEKIAPKENIYVLTNDSYADIVKEQLSNVITNNILLEPSRNNTAPCIAYAAYKIGKINPEANLIVAPSDHLILKEDIFLDKIAMALDFSAKHDALLTLGITPTRPDTGYGYIEFADEQGAKNKEQGTKNEELGLGNEIKKVSAFKEKPALEKAKEYLVSGDYVWNAGIFIWSVKSLINAFELHAANIAELFANGLPVFNTDKEADFIREQYPKSENISIDYAILERASNVYTIPADIGWSDLGTWASLHEVIEKDEKNNAINCDKINLKESSDCIIHLPAGKAAVIRGLNNFIVVDDGKALLIYPKNHEQEIKSEVTAMVNLFGKDLS